MDLNITQEADGYTAEGLPLSIFTLSNRHGMAVRISTRGGTLLSLNVPDRQGLLANVLRGGLANEGIHLLPAPGRALHRQAWHAVPLVDDASVGVRLVSPGAPAVVASYRLDDTDTLTLRCEVSAEVPATLCLVLGLNLGGPGAPGDALGGHLLTVQAERGPGAPWDGRSARYESASRLLLADPLGGRQLELAGAMASLRVSASEAPNCLLLEPAVAAPGGELAFHFSAKS